MSENKGDDMENRKKLLPLLLVIVGNLLYTLSVKLFLLPANLMSCGTTGIALLVNHFLNIPITVFIFGFNALMLAFGWLVLGRRFAMSTVLSSVLYPANRSTSPSATIRAASCCLSADTKPQSKE